MWLMFHFIIQTNQKKPHVNQVPFLVFIFPLQTNSKNNNEIKAGYLEDVMFVMKGYLPMKTI
jgi:hypothetical protein